MLPAALAMTVAVALATGTAITTMAVPAQAQEAVGGNNDDNKGCGNSKVCYIEITRDGFVPDDVRIGAQSTVVWKNIDDRIHAVSIYTRGGTLVFNSTLLRTGEIFQFTFAGNTFGTYEYFDEASSGMGGRITVAPDVGEGAARHVKVDFNSPGSGIESIFLSRGSVTGVELVPELKAIRVSLDAGQNDDTLRVKLDRNLIDAKDEGGRDARFEVTADGERVRYKEMVTAGERMLEIPVKSGADAVEIAGTHVSTQVLGYDMAVEALEEAEATTDGYRESGVIVSEADDLLMQARNAFEAGRYMFAKELAKEATEVAHAAGQAASVASRAMGEAEASIKATKTLGIDVSDAERILVQTREKYSYGGYDEALNMAVQARIAAASRTDQLALFGAIGASAGIIYLFLRFKGIGGGGAGQKGGISPVLEERQPPLQQQQQQAGDSRDMEEEKRQTRLDLDRVFAEKPHLREDDRQVLRYVVDRGGEVLLAEIRNDFDLPKSTAWRLVKRLEREELVQIIKFGNQNLVRCVDGRQEDSGSDGSKTRDETEESESLQN